MADPVWKRKGNDLVYYVDITLLSALESKPFSIVVVMNNIENVGREVIVFGFR